MSDHRSMSAEKQGGSFSAENATSEPYNEGFKTYTCQTLLFWLMSSMRKGNDVYAV